MMTNHVQALCLITERLAQLHGSGWVHRDLKPGNILRLPSQHSWTLMDFGCAARAGPVSALHIGAFPHQHPCCMLPRILQEKFIWHRLSSNLFKPPHLRACTGSVQQECMLFLTATSCLFCNPSAGSLQWRRVFQRQSCMQVQAYQ